MSCWNDEKCGWRLKGVQQSRKADWCLAGELHLVDVAAFLCEASLSHASWLRDGTTILMGLLVQPGCALMHAGSMMSLKKVDVAMSK